MSTLKINSGNATTTMRSKIATNTNENILSAELLELIPKVDAHGRTNPSATNTVIRPKQPKVASLFHFTLAV
jgi:hypothetical protein